ncbi:trehalose operon repressor [Clostridium sp. AF18-27]|uniref:Trehalose operon repressor n=1 Tax=Enterocloster lavalensis TaxID=460384 RepID=A0A1I0K1B8_9FIRM|nr:MULTISPECIES: trehalose operon repressor [Enterocloster]MCB6344776.1 trehalose operon repressor [Enterocloster lavalensis]MDR3759781.1 trehalose operon repressor [Enterocloster sp.]RHR47665.1 trehalose operon repressor [Clostridium sp. AF18-27]SEU17478.1 GntR family transcriptional regulator, trehalose operon transcriptional repressor [Enterocloster lavalensis]
MAKTKYDQIYAELRTRIEQQEYGFQELLPSENTLVKEYGCSRNTVRRAIGRLADEGYVQSLHGKGVRIIYQPGQLSEFMLSGIESLKEAVARNQKEYRTKVVCFAELTVDQRISARTTFPVGEEIYYIQRVRYIDGEALILDHNYFLKEVARDLTPEIAEQSIYAYLEQELGENIVTTKRKVTVERASQIDEMYLELGDYNCLAVVSSMTYNADGVMFEFTQSRHRPDKFAFYDLAHRVK